MTSTSATASRSTTATKTTPPSATPPSTPPADAAVRAGSSAFMQGHKGPAVTSLQDRLNRAGATPALAEDGTFGTKTRAAVERFQRDNNLPVDGKVGARTLAALEAATSSTPATAPTTRGDSLERGGGTSTGRSAPQAPAAPTPSTAAPRRGLAANGANGPAPTNASSTSTLPAGLGAAQRTTVTETLAGTHGAEARAAMTSLLGSAQFRQLAVPAQARLLTSVHASSTSPGGMLGSMLGGADPAATRNRQITFAANRAAALMQTTASRTGSAADRGRLVDVFVASPGGRPSLLALAGERGGPNRLTGHDLRGGTMLTHLATMATAPLGTGINRNDLLSSTMAEVRDPSIIEQEQQGTCAPTSVSLQLVARSPAEYVRLLAGVSSAAGTTTLANGDTLRRDSDSIGDHTTHRSISERLLQDSFMEYGNGNDQYRIAEGGGLTSNEINRLQTGVFNETHHTVGTSGRSAQRDASLSQRTWIGLRNAWDTVTFQRNADHPMEVLRERSGTPTTIAMRWGTQADSNHAVVVMRTENGRVYFQNPHGNAGNTVGQQLTPPPRRVEQGNVQSMTTADFERRLFAVSVPG